MTDESKPGVAVADKWRETFEASRKETDLALTRLEVRAEQRSFGDPEDTGVIHVEAAKRVAERMETDPPKSVGPVQVIFVMARKFPPWGAVLVALAAIAAYVALKLIK
jgi:hypothetical protein